MGARKRSANEERRVGSIKDIVHKKQKKYAKAEETLGDDIIGLLVGAG